MAKARCPHCKHRQETKSKAERITCSKCRLKTARGKFLL